MLVVHGISNRPLRYNCRQVWNLHASDDHSFPSCPSARQANKQHHGLAAQHASSWIKEQAAAGLNLKPEAAKDRRPKCNQRQLQTPAGVSPQTARQSQATGAWAFRW